MHGVIRDRLFMVSFAVLVGIIFGATDAYAKKEVKKDSKKELTTSGDARCGGPAWAPFRSAVVTFYKKNRAADKTCAANVVFTKCKGAAGGRKALVIRADSAAKGSFDFNYELDCKDCTAGNQCTVEFAKDGAGWRVNKVVNE